MDQTAMKKNKIKMHVPFYFWNESQSWALQRVKLIIKKCLRRPLRGGYSLDMMWLTSVLSTHSRSCLAASLVDVTVSPTGMRERGYEREMVGRLFLRWLLLTSSALYTHNTLHNPPKHTHTHTHTHMHAQQVTASSRRSLAKPKRCNRYSIVRPLNSLP